MTAELRRVLGIDPGSRVLGWGVVERQAPAGADPRDEGYRLVACGTLRLQVDDPVPARLVVIHRGIAALIGEHAPQAVSVEEAFAGRNVKSAIRLAEARAVCLLAAEQAGLPIHELPPALVKKSITGHGRAGKETVRASVCRLLGESVERVPALDAADALAVATCALVRAGLPFEFTGRPVGRRRRRGRGWTAQDIERIKANTATNTTEEER